MSSGSTSPSNKSPALSTIPPLPVITGLFREEKANAGAGANWLAQLWQGNLAMGYNFSLINICRDTSLLDDNNSGIEAWNKLPPGDFTRKAHRALGSRDWHSIGGVITSIPGKRMNRELAEHIFRDAAQWAKYLGMHSISFDLGKVNDSSDCNTAFYGRLIADVLQATVYEGFHVWIKTSFTDAAWCRWHKLRKIVGETPKNRLHVVLDLGELADAGSSTDAQLQRWFGESIQALALPTALFHSKPDGTVELPLNIQAVCREFFTYPNIKWLVSGPCLHQPDYSVYRDHIDALGASCTVTALDHFLRPSLDQLQRPMQPLQDHLQSSSYELFEQDPVKYAQYEKALRQALLEQHASSKVVTVMVLGAGRGPLVDVVLRAFSGLQCKPELLVIEKNPTAVVTLRHRRRDDWSAHDITIIETDMRSWQTAARADIIVSELLGSWGDNELSPECLDGARHLLKPGGISIPAAYTSYLRPISSARLYSAVAACAPWNFPEISRRRFFESTYVVKMGAAYMLAEEQSCFTFEHPKQQEGNNERQVQCRFRMPDSLSQVVVHGFRGTFACTLYGEHGISIAETAHSHGMFCWFPLFIPLQQPLTLQGGELLEVTVWRRVGKDKVWYEWQVQGHEHVHNQDARSSCIGLQN